MLVISKADSRSKTKKQNETTRSVQSCESDSETELQSSGKAIGRRRWFWTVAAPVLPAHRLSVQCKKLRNKTVVMARTSTRGRMGREKSIQSVFGWNGFFLICVSLTSSNGFERCGMSDWVNCITDSVKKSHKCVVFYNLTAKELRFDSRVMFNSTFYLHD